MRAAQRARYALLVVPGEWDLLGERAILRTYSTEKIAPVARLTRWNDIHCSVFMPMEVKPLDRASFEAEISFDMLGPVALVRTASRAATIEHSEKHVQQTVDRRAFLIMPIQGPVTLSCYGHESILNEGDFGLSDSLAASTTVLNSTNHALLLAIPYPLLTAHIPNPELFFGLRVPGDRGLGQTVNVLIRSLWAQVAHGAPFAGGQQLATGVLELVAAAYAVEHRTDVAASSLAVARRAQIKRFIEAHLRKPTLNAVAVGKALELSPRYVRMIFEAESEHISAYVLRRRLEECAKQLRDTLWLGRSITETAFDWGFTNTAYFTRAFKQHFGVTPTCYRRTGFMARANGLEAAAE